MTASRTVENIETTVDQPEQTRRRVSRINTYPLLGLALVVTIAAVVYGALFYFFIMD